MRQPRHSNLSRAFAVAQTAFGTHSDVSEQLARIERCPDGCPGLLLAAAIFVFTSASPEERTRMIGRYFDASAHPAAELLSDKELEDLHRLESQTYGSEA